jgi:tetratricopeptide (TPR) repeat protein
MPKRRTEDAVHVVMTDHFIQRVAREQLEERAEKPPVEYRGEVLPYGDSVEIYTAIANLKSGTARLRGAIERERPANPEYYLQLGDFVPGSVAALERRAMVDASLWPEVLRLDPQNVAAWVRYGVVSGSVEALEKAVALDPESDAAHAGLASVLMNRDPGRALREALEAVRLHPNDPGDRFVAALALSRMRRFVDARMQLDAALKIEPGRADLHRLYGNVLGASGDLRGAVAHFREVVRIEPGSARANFDLGMALQESGQTSAAQEFLRRAASLLWPLWVAVKS